MAEISLTTTMVASQYPSGIELLKAVAFPEISQLTDNSRISGGPQLKSKAKVVLEALSGEQIGTLGRRNFREGLELRRVSLIVAPPKRQIQWREPVQLEFEYLVWFEDNHWHSWVPVPDIHVFSARPDQIETRVKNHLQLVVVGLRRRIDLNELAKLQQVESLRIERLEVRAEIKSARSRAENEMSQEPDEAILPSLAEEFSGNPNDPIETFEVDPDLRRLVELLEGGGGGGGCVLLVGPAGCGKTALIRELARRRGEFGFNQARFWTTSGSRLMTGAAGFGLWQKRLERFCRELGAARGVVHLGNLVELCEVGKTRRGDPGVGDFIRPHLQRGEFTALAECTPEQLTTLDRLSPQLLATFVQLKIAVPSAKTSRQILGHLWKSIRPKDPLDVAEHLLDWIHQLHLRYATYSAIPGRSVHFVRNLLAGRPQDELPTHEEITQRFSRESGLPTVLLDDSVALDISSASEWFSQRIVGQPQAVERVVDLLTVIKARLARPRKPLASFLFAGPTGVGKTEMAKALSEFLFGSPDRLVRFDLGQFSDPISVQRLIGGVELGNAEGLMTARIREQPFSVLLLDEFEKADAGFFDYLLQILGDGRLTDATGRVADFCNSVIIMTSNLGAERLRMGTLGFQRPNGSDLSEHFNTAVQAFLRPEIYNRLDAIVPFGPLSELVVSDIAWRQIDQLRRRDGIALQTASLEVDPKVIEYLAKKGYDIRYGARPLKRMIEQHLLVPLAEELAARRETRPLDISVQLGGTPQRIQVRTRIASNTTPAKNDTAFCGDVVDRRRHCFRLRHSAAFTALENEISLLETLVRAHARMKWVSAADRQQVERLHPLKRCHARMQALIERVNQLETRVIAQHHTSVGANTSWLSEQGELESIQQESRSVRQELFRSGFDSPDFIHIAIYSKDREALIDLATSYYEIALELKGTITHVDALFTPTKEREKKKLKIRETIKSFPPFFQSPPDYLLGVIIGMTGDLFWPRWSGEAGLHLFRRSGGVVRSLVETSQVSMDKYRSPDGIEGKRDFQNISASVCRTFDGHDKTVDDSVLGRRPWNSGSVRGCVRELTAERLERAMSQIGAES